MKQDAVENPGQRVSTMPKVMVYIASCTQCMACLFGWSTLSTMVGLGV
jgi:Zn-dependent alcohol dehydrogenase